MLTYLLTCFVLFLFKSKQENLVYLYMASFCLESWPQEKAAKTLQIFLLRLRIIYIDERSEIWWRHISNFVKQSFYAYSEVKVGDQDKNWAPHIICNRCVNYHHRTKIKRDSLKFEIPLVWPDPQNHVDDCFFCLTNVGASNTKRDFIVCPDLLFVG